MLNTNITFMALIMENINKCLSHSYMQHYKKANHKSIEKLVQYIRKNAHMKHFESGSYHLNQIPTCGCRYRFRSGSICGCSMCNLSDQSNQLYAYMQALSERNRGLYIKVIQDIILKVKGQVDTLSAHEFIFAYNTLDSEELPDELLSLFFTDKGLYRRRPLSYEIETRIDSLNEERLKKLKQLAGKNPVWLRFGIETSDETIRNSWLNKNITNHQIKQAIQLCKSYGFHISANILLGLPGITEDLSLQFTKQTILELLDWQVDKIIVSVLSRTNHTLQHYIWSQLQDTILDKFGIVQGSHTGVPWLFTCVRLLHWIQTECNQSKISFGQFVPDYLQKECTVAYNFSPECSCNKIIAHALNEFAFQSDWKIPVELSKTLSKHFCHCYKEYDKILERQRSLSSIQDNMRVIAKELARKMYGYNWESFYSTFLKEIQNKNI